MKRKISIILAMVLLLQFMTSCKPMKTESGEISEVTSETDSQKYAWWQNWPIFSNNSSNFIQLSNVGAEASTALDNLRDEGIGPYMRAYNNLERKNELNLLTKGNIKKNAWIESYGESRAYIIGLHQNEDGSFRWNDQVDGAEMLAHYWSWETNGVGANADTNYIAWVGVHSYVNKEAWLGKHIITDDVPMPTYPNGELSVGYLEENTKSPLLAKLYDAHASKDINGKIYATPTSSTFLNSTGFVKYTTAMGATVTAGDISFGKDVASPWWPEYTRVAVRDLLAQGATGFWIDNYDGWDTISAKPCEKMFGDWSEYLFKDYLKKHKELGVTNPDRFEITDYLKAKALEFDSTANPNSINDAIWLDERWSTEPIWNAYKTFKSEMLTQRLTEIYTIIKDEAQKQNIDPNEIAVTVNGGPIGLNDHFNGENFDISSTEYLPAYNTVTGTTFNGLAPVGGAGPVLSLISTASKKSTNSVVWYYGESGGYEAYRSNPNLGIMVGFECVANNIIANLGEQDKRQIGNDRSARLVFKAIKELKSVFGQRQQYSPIGVLYSQASEYVDLLPGGFYGNGYVAHTLGYLGWTMSMEKANIPYVGFMDYRLKDYISDLKILVLPNMKSISQSTIDDVIKPWLDKGNTLIVTGDDAGSRGNKDEFYKVISSPRLVGFAQSYKGQGKIHYIENDPGASYYLKHFKSGGTDDLQGVVVSEIDLALKERGLSKPLTVNGLTSVMTTMNYNKDTDTLFADLVNYNFDLDKDAYTQKVKGTITVTVPNSMIGKKLQVKYYSFDTKKIDTLVAEVTTKDGQLSIEVPEFEVYTSIMISKI